MPRWTAGAAFARPTSAALQAIASASPEGVVEIGAGTGYWARCLHDRGVDVVAFDVAPPPSVDNPWFAGLTPWYPVQVGDETAVDPYPRRTLLLVWPTRNEDWGADVARRFATVGGACLAFVGEPAGGRTGDDRLHALMGEIDRCWSCAYGLQSSPCVCGTRPLWRRTATAGELRLYDRDASAGPLSPRPTSGSWLRRIKWT